MQKNPSIRKRMSIALGMLSRKGYEETYNDIRKNLGLQMTQESYGYSDVYNYHPQDIYRPREKLSFRRRNRLFIDCAILRVVIDKVNKETHRKGLAIQKDFARICRRVDIKPCKNIMHQHNAENGKSPIIEDCGQCPNPHVPLGQDECGEEYQTEQIRCKDCRMPTRSPKVEQKRRLRQLLKKPVNLQNQTLTQVITHVNMDVEKHDNGFILTKFIYTWKDPDRDIYPTSKKWVQTYRGNPARIRPVIRKEGELSSHYYTCIIHRAVYEMHRLIDNYDMPNRDIPRCHFDISPNVHTSVECGQPLQKVYYVQILEEGAENDVRYAYIKGEVIHIKKYSPAGAMGVSLIDSLYYTILQLIGQEKWIAEYYLKMRMFKGYFAVPNEMGGTQDSLQRLIFSEFAKWRQDPYYTPIFGIPKDSKDMKYNRLDDSPKELQFIENRTEGRQQVANAYGMSNVWMNDSSTGAGMNNQGVEIMITNRHIEYGQRILVEQGLKPLCATILNCEVDKLEYYIGYNPHEEQDLMAEKQRTALDIANSRAAQELGADVYINEDREFVYASPIEGSPLVPMSMQMTNKQSYQDVEGTNEEGLQYERRSDSKPFTGSPNEPKAGGSEITTKSDKGSNTIQKQKLDNLTIGIAKTENAFDILRVNKNSGLFEISYSQIIDLIDNHMVFIAKNNENIIGYSINMFDNNTQMFHLISIAVDKEYQGKGIGKNLIEETKGATEMFSVNGIFLEVRKSNLPAIKMYTNTGFVKKEIIPNFYPDGESAVNMEYILKRTITKQKVTFKDVYKQDWEGSKYYDFIKFKTIKIDDVLVPEDYGIDQQDPKKATINYFMENPKDMPCLTVEDIDGNYYLLDGYHRLFVIKKLETSKVRVAVVMKNNEFYKEADPEFNEKHPRDEGGKFQAKPKADKPSEGGGAPRSPKAQEAGTPSIGAPTTQTGTAAVASPEAKQPQTTSGNQQPQGDIMAHLQKYGGFLLTEELQYYPGGGFWIGIPLEKSFTLADELTPQIAISMVKGMQNVISQMPMGDYLIGGWIQEDKFYVGLGEVHKEMGSALINAEDNRELEVWDFANNTAIVVKTQKPSEDGDEIIYDFFIRRNKYWEGGTMMSVDEYLQIRGE